MNLTLTRFAYSRYGTYGELVIEKTPFKCFTVERPWQNNEHSVSCIPEGLYQIEPCIHHPGTPKAYPAYLLLGTAPRDAIHIHIANTMYDVQGCIGLGNILGCSKVDENPFPVWSVLNSATTFKQFMETMNGQRGQLYITFTANKPQ